MVHFYNVFNQAGRHLDMITDANHNTNVKWGHNFQIKYSKYRFLDFNISKMELAKRRISLMGVHDI